jgi:lipid-binding SYLF domain-containing protein
MPGGNGLLVFLARRSLLSGGPARVYEDPKTPKNRCRIEIVSMTSSRSHCIMLVPGLKKGGFVVAAKYGRGFVVCRHDSGQGWGPPGAVRIEGGSVGLQIGVSSTDLVLLVMNQRGMKKLLTSKFTLGGDAARSKPTALAPGSGSSSLPPTWMAYLYSHASETDNS